MASLGSLVVSLAVDTARFQGDLGRAAHLAEARMRNIKDTASKALGAVTIYATAAGAALTVALKGAIDRADDMRDMAQAAGVTVEQLSRLAYAGKQSGVEIEQIGKALAKLAKDGAPNANAALLSIADRFKAMPDSAEKTALAIEYFGERLGPGLIPLLNEGADGLRRLAEESDRTGSTLSGSAAAAADEFNDKIGFLKASVVGFTNNLAANLLPSLNNIVDVMTEAAEESDAFGRAAQASATFVRYLTVGVVGLATAFDMLGLTIGARIAQMDQLRRFNFREAGFIGDELVADLTEKAATWHELRKAILSTESALSLTEKRLQAMSRGGGSGILAGQDAPTPGGTGTPKKVDPMAGLNELNVYAREVFNFANAQAEAFNKFSAEANETLRKDLQATSNETTRMLGGMTVEYKRSMSAMVAFSEQMGTDIRGILAEFLFDPFKDGLDGMLSNFVDMLRKMVAQIAAQQLLTSFFSWGSGLGGGTGNFFNGLLKGITGKAVGGPVMAGGAYLVGERGPEVLKMGSASGTIIPNNALAGSGANVTVNNVIHANGADADRIMAIMPGLLRQSEQRTVAQVQQLIQRGRLA